MHVDHYLRRSVGLISVRAQEIYDAVPDNSHSLLPVREYRDLLMLSGPGEETRPQWSS